MIRKWLTSVALVVSMLIAAVGVGAHQQEGSMSKLPDCCKKARSHGPQASIARLCCNLNCSDPGSTGNSSPSSFSTQQGPAPNLATLSAAQFQFQVVVHRHSQQVHLPDSNPRYIKHLALLI